MKTEARRRVSAIYYAKDADRAPLPDILLNKEEIKFLLCIESDTNHKKT
ncbi:hypothetical protein ACP3S8_20080 [Mixta calida]